MITSCAGIFSPCFATLYFAFAGEMGGRAAAIGEYEQDLATVN